jgi:hypothetical protein
MYTRKIGDGESFSRGLSTEPFHSRKIRNEHR